MATSPPSPQLLLTKILVSRPLLEGWLPVIAYLLPLTSGILNDELEAIQTQINTLLAQSVPVTQNPTTVIIPFTLLVSFQNALNNYQNVSGGGGFPANNYADARGEVNSLMDNVSAAYWNTSQPQNLITMVNFGIK